MPTDGKIDGSAVLIKFLGDLAARSATANNENGTRRKFVWISIGARMHLNYAMWQCSRQVGQRGPLEWTRRHYDSGCFDCQALGLDNEFARISFPSEGGHLRIASHRSVDKPGIVVHERRHLSVMGKCVRMLAGINKTRQLQCPVGKLKCQRIPPLAVPAF